MKSNKCPWCGREVEVRKGRLMPHLQSSKVRCVGGGVTIQDVRQIEGAREKRAGRWITASIYGGIVLSSVDGPGQRAVVHFAGCSIRCPGCFNTAIWSGTGSRVRRMPVAELARAIHRVSRRVTISGGEPTDQPLALVALLRELRRGGGDIVLFTGRRWEALSGRPELAAIARERLVDAVIDGPFEFEHAEGGQVTRGSTNQQIIHLTGRLTDADFAHRDVQVHLDLDGRTTVTGFPSRDLLVALRHGEETDHG